MMPSVTVFIMMVILSADITTARKCLKVPAMEGFNVTKLAETVVWYFQYYDCSDDFDYFQGRKCQESITSRAKNLGSNHFYYTLKAITVETNKPLFTLYQESFDETDNELTAIKQSPAPWGPVHSTIMLTDYVSYKVVYMCAESKSNPGKIYLSVRIATPCPQAPPIDLKPIYKLLENHKIDVKLEHVDRSNCTCDF